MLIKISETCDLASTLLPIKTVGVQVGDLGNNVGMVQRRRNIGRKNEACQNTDCFYRLGLLQQCSILAVLVTVAALAVCVECF